MSVSCVCPKCEHAWTYTGRVTPDKYVTCPACHRKSPIERCMIYSSARDELAGQVQEAIKSIGINAVLIIGDYEMIIKLHDTEVDS